MKAAKISPLLHRILEGEPGFFVEERSGGECFYCSGGGSGEGASVPRLFAVAAQGGVLLRLPAKVRAGVIERGLGQPNSVLPDWVLKPPQAAREDASSPGPNGGELKRDPRMHGAPEEWVWMPIEDPETFERRRPHIMETLAYCRYELDDEANQKESKRDKR